jgi:hypothetical protein
MFPIATFHHYTTNKGCVTLVALPFTLKNIFKKKAKEEL